MPLRLPACEVLAFLFLGMRLCNGVWFEVEIWAADSGGDVKSLHDSRDFGETDDFADVGSESDRLRLRVVAIGR